MKIRKTGRRILSNVVRGALFAAAIAAPLVAVQSVRANTDTFIGETPTMSNGVGLVLMVSLQRS